MKAVVLSILARGRRGISLVLLAALSVGLVVLVFADGSEQVDGRAGYVLRGPLAANPGGTSEQGAIGPCETLIREAGLGSTYASKCTLGLLVDTLGPPNKVARRDQYYDYPFGPKFYILFLYLSKGLECTTGNISSSGKSERDSQVVSCDHFKPTTWRVYSSGRWDSLYDRDIRGYEDWDGFRN